MRTRQLSVTVGAYSNGEWYTALLSTTYEAGRLVSSEVQTHHWTTEERVLEYVERAVHGAIRLEQVRVAAEAARDHSRHSAALAEDGPG